MADKPGPISKGDLVQSFERGLAVIRAFDGHGPELTLTEVAELAGVTRAAARRFLLTLAEVGYVHTDGKRFWLRPRILELGNAFLSSQGLAEVARPHLDKLVAEVDDSAALCVLEDDEIVYVGLVRTPARRIMALNVTIGSRIPAHPSSMGRVLLAFQPEEWRAEYLKRVELQPFTPRTVKDPAKLGAILDRVRADDYALVDQELDLGLRSIAVPLRHEDGQVYASLNVSMHSTRRSKEEMRGQLLEPLRRSAGEIEADLRAIARRRQSFGVGDEDGA
ncbi:IclR family transcriptional regulator C-terminal domain-containing protein [Amycolatopsis sp. NPDC005232]|uniref:IclR family transcriptional regulator domain-containing protein n=1 Tax=Amycolatopsis sp. NPDC005232 TaxID=3157027 RepID=UPI0033B6B6B5